MGACQDERNRLTWMGLAGESTRGGTAIVPGSLTGAQYTQTFGYDKLDRLTSGPLGTYTYGDAAHLHAATAIGSAYTASYDAAGDMTCRAPNAFQTCAGSTPTGAPLTFDNEGRLASWTSTAQSCLSSHNPMTTETFAYDGEGRRVAESGVVRQCPYATQVVYTTEYLGDLEEVYGGTPPTNPMTKYFATPSGLPMAMRAGSTLSYLATDGLGSVSEALDGGGNVPYQGLYAPYGGARYSRGGSPTTRGFTGQRGDTASGLDYFNARYYDPVAGQFLSADTVADGLNRYGYVAGNPETATDPTGHRIACGPEDGCGGGSGGSSGGTGPSTGCTSDAGCGCYASCGGGGNSGGGAGGGFSGTGTHLDALLGATCIGGPLQCPPTPEPVPCANVQNQCTTPPSNTDEPYDDLRAIATHAEDDLWNRIDEFQSLKQAIADLLSAFPDIKGWLHNILLGFDNAIAVLQNLQIAFYLQSNWSDSQWTAQHLAQFEFGIEANTFGLALSTNFLVTSMAQVEALTGNKFGGLLGDIEAGYRSATAVASGEALGVVSVAFAEEDNDMLECLPFCGD